jgi:hypothetical protein
MIGVTGTVNVAPTTYTDAGPAPFEFNARISTL